MQAIYVIGFNLAAACAFGRAAAVLIGGIRSLLGRSRFELVRFGLAEALAVPERRVPMLVPRLRARHQ